jgi:CRP-like cAMP-binding protein
MREIIELAEKNATLSRNEFLTFAGKIDTNIYYVESGALIIYVVDGSEMRVIRFGYKENLIVALDSFLSGKPTVFFIQAVRKTKLKIICKKHFEDFLQIGNNYQWWQKITEELLLQQIEREIDLLTESPLERYKRVFSRSPRLFQEIPNKYIANYLRMTPETLSRLKKL